MTSPVRDYLRNHEAAAHGGLALFRRAARQQQYRPWGGELAQLRDEVRSDLDSLRGLMRYWGVSPDRRLETVMRLGELLGRAKPNGRLLRRSLLSDLVEVEAMLDAVHAKHQGWIALLAAEAHSPTETVELTELNQRAEEQQHQLQRIHRTAAADVLGGESGLTSSRPEGAEGVASGSIPLPEDDQGRAAASPAAGGAAKHAATTPPHP